MRKILMAGLMPLMLLAGAPASAGDRLEIPPELVAKWEDDARWIVAGRVLDLGATEYALAQGVPEGNPLMRDRGVRLAANAAFVVGASLACKHFRKTGRPGMARWTARGIFAVSAVFAIHAVVQGHGGPGR